MVFDWSEAIIWRNSYEERSKANFWWTALNQKEVISLRINEVIYEGEWLKPDINGNKAYPSL